MMSSQQLTQKNLNEFKGISVCHYSVIATCCQRTCYRAKIGFNVFFFFPENIFKSNIAMLKYAEQLSGIINP